MTELNVGRDSMLRERPVMANYCVKKLRGWVLEKIEQQYCLQIFGNLDSIKSYWYMCKATMSK